MSKITVTEVKVITDFRKWLSKVLSPKQITTNIYDAQYSNLQLKEQPARDNIATTVKNHFQLVADLAEEGASITAARVEALSFLVQQARRLRDVNDRIPSDRFMRDLAKRAS